MTDRNASCSFLTMEGKTEYDYGVVDFYYGERRKSFVIRSESLKFLFCENSEKV